MSNAHAELAATLTTGADASTARAAEVSVDVSTPARAVSPGRTVALASPATAAVRESGDCARSLAAAGAAIAETTSPEAAATTADFRPTAARLPVAASARSPSTVLGRPVAR